MKKINLKKERLFLTVYSVFITAVTFSCGPIPNIQELEDVDITPPLFLAIRTLNAEEVEIDFDEKTVLNAEQTRLVPPAKIKALKDNRKDTRVFTERQIPGLEYRIRVSVADERGNSNTFIVKFYGFNPAIPELLINEFTTQGSGKHPDTVELKAVSKGNMGGITLYDGTPKNYRSCFVFPDFKVNENDFILIHFKPQGIPEEVNETECKDLSGGYDSSKSAYDFWLKGGTGLSANNGVLTLFSRPGGKLLDGILYSNRTSASDEKYRGFGMRDTMERADELADSGGWQTEDTLIKPEDAVNPEDSTGTRSICRNSLSADTDSKKDWHIVPTRKASFGEVNSDEEY